MRNLGIASLLVASLAACSPYDPDLGGLPYRCAADMPRCPDGYFCNEDDVCENIQGVGPDSGQTGGFQCEDDSSIEGPSMNDTIQTAYSTPVSGTRNSQSYGQLAICPEGDKDTYLFTSTMGRAIEVTATSVEGQPVTVNILGAGGAMLAAGMPMGANGSRAFIASAPQTGSYFAQVSAGPTARANYEITISVN